MALATRTQLHWDSFGAKHAILAALRADLPHEVTIMKIDEARDPVGSRRRWVIRFILPHMDQSADIIVEQEGGDTFPYDEVLTKIRLFLA